MYIERVGKLDIEELWKHTNTERMLTYYTLSYETLLQKIFPACTAFKVASGKDDGVKVTQTLTILDLKDVSLGSASKVLTAQSCRHIASSSQLPRLPKTTTLKCLERTTIHHCRMFIINAPFLFSGVWMMIKPWLDEKTAKKIKIIGSGYKKELLEFIDAENLPDFLDGGQCKCAGNGGDCLSWNIGPWNPQGKELFDHAVAP